MNNERGKKRNHKRLDLYGSMFIGWQNEMEAGWLMQTTKSNVRQSNPETLIVRPASIQKI